MKGIKIQQTFRKHPLIWAIVGFIFGTFPQWLSGTWALFSSTPLFQWLQSKGLKMPTFSLTWITFPIGMTFIAYIWWLTRRKIQFPIEKSNLSDTDEPFQSDNQSQKKLTEMVDLIRSEKHLDKRYDSIGALIKYANDFQTESEVKWYCEQLEKSGYKHPFKLMEDATENALQGKWLQFLREARLRSKTIRLNVHAWDFAITKWSGTDDFKKGHHAILGIKRPS